MITYKTKDNSKYIQADPVDPILLNQSTPVPFFHYPALDNTGLVKHGFSTKMGGVSSGIFTSLNFRKDFGDDPANIEENYRRICASIGLDWDKAVMANQTHTTEVREVTADMLKPGRTLQEKNPFKDVDGLVTDVPGAVLITSYADCVPLYFLDPVHKAIGLSHSGRRGTVNRMGKVTLEKMRMLYGTRPEDVIACIGPSICQDCYEVGPEVAEEFADCFSQEELKDILSVNEKGRYQLDLWKANERILLDAGIVEEHLSITNVCTCCNHELLFSHRYTHGQRGNLNAFLSLI